MTTQDAHIATKQGAVELHHRELSADAVLEALYDEYAHMLFRYAVTLVGSSDDAEDVVQEVFTRVAQQVDRMRSIENPKSYLFTATRNAAYSLLRGRLRQHQLQTAICAELITSDHNDIPPDPLLVCQSFTELPVEQREVLVLKVFEEMTFKQIANMVGASLNTVASRYRYGIEKLRQSMEVEDHE